MQLVSEYRLTLVVLLMLVINGFSYRNTDVILQLLNNESDISKSTLKHSARALALIWPWTCESVANPLPYFAFVCRNYCNYRPIVILDPGRVPKRYDIVVVVVDDVGVVVTVFEKCLRLC